MSPDGTIHAIKDYAHKLEIEKEYGELIDLEKDTAAKLAELPASMRKAFYQATKESVEHTSPTKTKATKAKIKKKNKVIKAAKRKNRR